jgi:hypothetical protein
MEICIQILVVSSAVVNSLRVTDLELLMDVLITNGSGFSELGRRINSVEKTWRIVNIKHI